MFPWMPSFHHSPAGCRPHTGSLWQRGHLSLHCHCPSSVLTISRPPRHPMVSYPTMSLFPAFIPSEASIVWQSDCSKENTYTIFTLLLRILVSSPLLMDQSRMPLCGTQGLFQAGLSLPFQLYRQHSRLQQTSGLGRVPGPHYVCSRLSLLLPEHEVPLPVSFLREIPISFFDKLLLPSSPFFNVASGHGVILLCSLSHTPYAGITKSCCL